MTVDKRSYNAGDSSSPKAPSSQSLAAKTARLKEACPDAASILSRATSLLQSKRFVNYKTLNGVNVQTNTEGEPAFCIALYLKTTCERAFAVLGDENTTGTFNAFWREQRLLRQGEDFAEYEQQLQVGLDGPKHTKRFLKMTFTEEGVFYILELPAGGPGPNAAATLTLTALRPHQATRRTLLQVVTVPGRSTLRGHCPELLSFHHCLVLEAEVLFLQRFAGREGGEADAARFPDRRAALSPAQLREVTAWREKMIATEPRCADMHVNVFVRFYLGYNGQYPLYENFFKKFVEFYDTQLRGMRLEDFPALHAPRPLVDLGPAFSGHAVMLLRFRRLMSADEPLNTPRYIARFVADVMERADPTVDGMIFIIDCKGYTSRNVTLDGIKSCAALFGNTFPNALHRLVVLNMSGMMSMLFGTIKLFLHEVTQKKVVIAPAGGEQMRKTLAEWLPAERIPAEYGGAMPDN